MAYLPYLTETDRTTSITDTFAGINKGFRISESYFSDTYNMCSNDYPALAVRPKRTQISFTDEDDNVVGNFKNPVCSAVVINDMLVTLTTGGVLQVGSTSVELGISGENRILNYGGKLYIYPAGVVVNIDFSEETPAVEFEKTAVYYHISPASTANEDEIAAGSAAVGYCELLPYISDAIGKTYTVSRTAPEDPSAGDYWYNTTDGTLNFYNSNDEEWTGVSPTLIKVSTYTGDYSSDDVMPAPQWVLSQYATVYLETDDPSLEEDCNIANGYYLVEYVEDDGIYLAGVMDKMWTLTGDYTFTLERKMPVIDFAVAHNNRIWACRYGSSADGEFVNEIYASALGSPHDWYTYEGLSTDSWTASVVSDGKFTGAAIVGGYVTFFKENCMHRIYGDYPSAYTLYSDVVDGVQEGCEQSIVTSNGITYYKACPGVMAISDSLPVSISSVLGTDIWSEAYAAVNGDRYYISMTDGSERRIYVYDITNGIWHTENSPADDCIFVTYKNAVYALWTSTERFDALPDVIACREKLESDEYSAWQKAILKIYLNLYTLFYREYTLKMECLSLLHKDITVPEYISVINKDLSANTDEDEDTDTVEETISSNITTVEKSLSDERSDDIKWFFETGEIGYGYDEKKYIDKLIVKTIMDPYSVMHISVMYNSDGLWHDTASIRGADTVKVFNIPLRPERCDYFKLRFSGEGEMKLINITEYFTLGSEI